MVSDRLFDLPLFLLYGIYAIMIIQPYYKALVPLNVGAYKTVHMGVDTTNGLRRNAHIVPYMFSNTIVSSFSLVVTFLVCTWFVHLHHLCAWESRI